MATISDFIKCPKCQLQFMKQTLGTPVVGKEYFCHRCHKYFSVQELCEHYGYDGGDLVDAMIVHMPEYSKLVCQQLIQEVRDEILRTDTVSINQWTEEFNQLVELDYSYGEPTWTDLLERIEAQEVVARMLLGVPEWEDCSVDTGATHA